MRRAGGRRAVSSVYGFIVIYLLVMASLQAISLALSAGEGADEAAQRAQQVDQLRTVERLAVTLSGGNLTVTNDGLIPSSLSSMLLRNSSVSRVVSLDDSLPVGASVVEDLAASMPFPTTAAVVTTLGNVFEATVSSAGPRGAFKVLGSAVGGPDIDAQIYQNPADPTRFFLAVGSSAFAFSSSTGKELWSFNASQGEVTDVLPLSDGGVYVSDGYFGSQFTSDLYRLSSAGTCLATYSMRLLKLWTTVEIQYPNGGLPPWPFGSQPVDKGEDSLFAYYDGWFFSSAGPSSVSLPADSNQLATSDSDQFYLATFYANPGGYGCSQPGGNTATFNAYSADSRGVIKEWGTTVYLDSCDYYPNEVISSSSGGGTLAVLLSQVYWSTSTYYGGPYQGANPFLAVLSSSTGAVMRSGTMDSSGYTSVVTSGNEVYLAIPSSDEVEVVSASGSGPGSFYGVGIPASSLQWADGSLFAIAPDEVKVYSPTMALENTIQFAPETFYSLSTSKPMEAQMVAPSFVVLNSTDYAALLRNSTGYGTLVVGGY